MGRISSCKEGKGQARLWEKNNVEKRSNISFQLRLWLFGSGEEGKGASKFEEEHQDFKNGDAEEFQGNYIHPWLILIYPEPKKNPGSGSRKHKRSTRSWEKQPFLTKKKSYIFFKKYNHIEFIFDRIFI